MKVELTTPARQTTTKSRASAKAGASSFQTILLDSRGVDQVAYSQDSLDSVPKFDQEEWSIAGDALQQQAKQALSMLNDLHSAMVRGDLCTDDFRKFQDLSTQLDRTKIDDKLCQILDEIQARVHVEQAKIDAKTRQNLSTHD